MKKLLVVVSFCALVTAIPFSTFAQSAEEFCRSEALDSGIENEEEIQGYVSECLEQVKSEESAEASEPVNSAQNAEAN